jgi:hypothetical protein
MSPERIIDGADLFICKQRREHQFRNVLGSGAIAEIIRAVALREKRLQGAVHFAAPPRDNGSPALADLPVHAGRRRPYLCIR